MFSQPIHLTGNITSNITFSLCMVILPFATFNTIMIKLCHELAEHLALFYKQKWMSLQIPHLDKTYLQYAEQIVYK